MSFSRPAHADDRLFHDDSIRTMNFAFNLLLSFLPTSESTRCFRSRLALIANHGRCLSYPTSIHMWLCFRSSGLSSPHNAFDADLLWLPITDIAFRIPRRFIRDFAFVPPDFRVSELLWLPIADIAFGMSRRFIRGLGFKLLILFLPTFEST
jgi:hypothetical protein